MADQRSRLTMDILARVRGTQDVQRLASAVDDTGDEMDSAARDARQLDRAVDELSDEIAELNRELLRTGDVDVFEKLREQRGTLTMLKRMRRELGDVETEARGTGIAISEAFRALPAQLKGAAIVGISGTVIAVAPLIGAAVAAAVLGGVGAGGIIGGVASAARDPRVKGAAQHMVGVIEGPFSDLGDAFVDPAVQALGILGEAGSDLIRDLSPQIKALAPLVVDLAEGVAEAARRAGPGIADALEASQPVLEALADELPELGEAMGDMLSTIAGGSEGAAAGLRTVFNLVETTLRVTGQLVRLLSDAFEQLARNADTFQRLIDQIPFAGEAFQLLSGDAADTTVRFRELGDVGVDAADRIADGFGGVRISVNEASDAIRRQIDLLRAQTDPVFALIKAQQELRDKQAAYNEALKEHGSESKEAREAQVALAEAAIDLVGASGDAAGTFDGKLTPAMRAAFEAAGLTEEQIDDLRSVFKDAGKDAEDLREDLLRLSAKYNIEVQTKYTSIGAPPQIRGSRVAVQHGGEIFGPAGIDRVPAMLTAGEFVVRREQAQRHLELLHAINSGTISSTVVRGGDGPAMSAVPEVRVFIGDRELTDIVRVEVGDGISAHDRELRREARQGTGAAR